MLEKVSDTQPQIGQLLSSQISGGILPKSLLFTGPRYCGKLHCAYHLAGEMGSIGEGNFALSTNRDFQLQISFALNCFSKLCNAATSEFLKENLYLFLSQFHSALATDDRDQKAYDCAGQLTELLASIDDIHEDDLKGFCNEVDAAYQATQKALGAQRSQKKAGLLSISQVRAFQSWAYLTSMGKSPKVIVLEGIEDANESTRNSLLKILEEPPEKCYFILLSAYPERLLNTILSRTRKYPFLPLDSQARSRILARLGQQTRGSEDLSLEESFLKLSSSQIPQIRAFAEGFLVDPEFDLNKLLSKIESTRLQSVFYRELSLEIESLFRQGKLTASRAAAMLDKLTRTTSRAEVFNQNPKLTIQALFYSLREESLK